MIDAFYQNKSFYFNLMKDFVNNQCSALELQDRYFRERILDIDKNTASGYSDYYLSRKLGGNQKKFKEDYVDALYLNAYSRGLEILKVYSYVARKLSIKGEMFFQGIVNFIEEFIREYTPRDASYFNPEHDVDEKTLRKNIQAAFDVLENNKDLW